MKVKRTPNHKDKHTTTDLMAALGYSQQELEANRQGHITEEQRFQLRQSVILKTVGYGLVTAFVIGVLLSSASPFFPSEPSDNVLSNMFRYIVQSNLGIPIALIAVVVIIIFEWRQLNADLAEGSIKTVEGTVILGYFPSKGRRYRLSIGYFDFEIPSAVHKAMKDGKTYRVYFTPRSRKVLAIEAD